MNEYRKKQLMRLIEALINVDVMLRYVKEQDILLVM